MGPRNQTQAIVLGANTLTSRAFPLAHSALIFVPLKSIYPSARDLFVHLGEGRTRVLGQELGEDSLQQLALSFCQVGLGLTLRSSSLRQALLSVAPSHCLPLEQCLGKPRPVPISICGYTFPFLCTLLLTARLIYIKSLPSRGWGDNFRR